MLVASLALNAKQNHLHEVGRVPRAHRGVVQQRRVVAIGRAASIGLVTRRAIAEIQARGVDGGLDGLAAQHSHIGGGLAPILPCAFEVVAHRGHGPQIFGDGLDVLHRHLRKAVLHGFTHRTFGLCHAGHTAGAQVLHELFGLPCADAARRVRGDVERRPARERRASQIAAAALVQRLLLHGETARCMARAAVRQALREVRTAIPRRRLVTLGGVRLALEEEKVPKLERPAHVQRPSDRATRPPVFHRRHAVAEVRIEIAHVRIPIYDWLESRYDGCFYRRIYSPRLYI